MEYKESKDYASSILEVGGDYYLFQGEFEDEIVMFRKLNNILDCEKDNVQKMLEQ